MKISPKFPLIIILINKKLFPTKITRLQGFLRCLSELNRQRHIVPEPARASDDEGHLFVVVMVQFGERSQKRKSISTQYESM